MSAKQETWGVTGREVEQSNEGSKREWRFRAQKYRIEELSVVKVPQNYDGREELLRKWVFHFVDIMVTRSHLEEMVLFRGWEICGSQNYSRYMNHSMAKGYEVRKVLFRPYEDVLGIGHSTGWSSIHIPGSGEPNFDSWVANPFETYKQRREKEVCSLLDKLPPETMMLDPTKIGTVRLARKKEKPSKQEREAEMEAVERAKRPFLEQQMEEKEEDESSKKASP
ncbi:hypothetical protein U1Q18_038268 [Sarracenia purpurea var. burkii]